MPITTRRKRGGSGLGISRQAGASPGGGRKGKTFVRMGGRFYQGGGGLTMQARPEIGAKSYNFHFCVFVRTRRGTSNGIDVKGKLNFQDCFVLSDMHQSIIRRLSMLKPAPSPFLSAT